MSSLSDYLENKLALHVFCNTAYTSPTTIYAALCTSATSDSALGTEVSTGSYARTAIAFSATGAVASNSANCEFPQATASWSTITHAALMDASSSGNILVHGALSASKAIGSGDIFRFSTGQVTITFA
jgi:hypothetical protein